MTEEQAFLAAILAKPGDDARKMAYADWLEERGDPRGEFLRGIVEFRQQRVITPDQRQRHQEISQELASRYSQPAQVRRQRTHELDRELEQISSQLRRPIPIRLQELAKTLDPKWLAVVSDLDIENCLERVRKVKRAGQILALGENGVHAVRNLAAQPKGEKHGCTDPSGLSQRLDGCGMAMD